MCLKDSSSFHIKYSNIESLYKVIKKQIKNRREGPLKVEFSDVVEIDDVLGRVETDTTANRKKDMWDKRESSEWPRSQIMQTHVRKSEEEDVLENYRRSDYRREKHCQVVAQFSQTKE